jgi:hypothetical protein
MISSAILVTGEAIGRFHAGAVGKGRSGNSVVSGQNGREIEGRKLGCKAPIKMLLDIEAPKNVNVTVLIAFWYDQRLH